MYLALVHGHPPPSGTWRDTLVWDKSSLIQRETHRNDPRGKEAVAVYRVIESFLETSLIEVRLHTGKRNQIRMQALLRGHTLVGEQRYTREAAVAQPFEFPRQALHAYRLTFAHPADGRELRFEAPIPRTSRISSGGFGRRTKRRRGGARYNRAMPNPGSTSTSGTSTT